MNIIKLLLRIRLLFLTWLLLPTVLVAVGIVYLLGVLDVDAFEAPDNFELPSNPVALRSEEFVWDGNAMVTYWFDGGWESQYQLGVDELRERGVEGALSVSTFAVGLDESVNWNQLQRMQYLGWEVSSLSRSHDCYPEGYSDQQMTSEVVGSQQDLFLHGIEVRDYVLPCGVITTDLSARVRKYYRSIRSTNGGVNLLPVGDPYYILSVTVTNETTNEEIREWISLAKKEKGWLVFSFNKVGGSEMGIDVSKDRVLYVVDQVERAGLQVVSPSEALSITSNEVEKDSYL